MDTASKKDLDALANLKEKISGLNLPQNETSDIQLLRWIRAGNSDAKKAEELLNKLVKWREEMKVEDLKNWSPPSYFMDIYEFEITGYLEDGSPVIIAPIGAWDVKKAVKANKQDFVKFALKTVETLIEEMRGKTNPQNGNEVIQGIGIFDFGKYSYRQLKSIPTVETLLELVKYFEAYYPERIRTIYVINAPKLFEVLFGMIKPLLTKRTRDSIEIYGCNEEEWKPILQKNIPADQYPIIYGGTGNFVHLNQKGERNTTCKIKSSIDFSNFAKLKVLPGKSEKLEFVVEKPDSVLSWCFKVKRDDVGFSVSLNDQETIQEYKLVNSGIADTNSIVCKPGKYFLTFDNTYNKQKHKKIYYEVKVDLPEEA